MHLQAELRKAGLDDYDVRPMGGRLMLIKPPGEVNLANMELRQIRKLARWFDSVWAWSKSDVGIEELCGLDAWVSLFIRDKDKFPSFIAEERMAIYEKIGSIVYAGTGSSEESSEASFPYLALLSVVPESIGDDSVGDDLVAGKLLVAILPWESNTEVQNPLLAINDLADVVREEPIRNDG
ncbi:hypothetical protein Ancab_025398 [Ancistrocladus abbreviatus]